MYRLIHPMILLLLAGMVTGCASMSKKDCENADWHAIGYSDGARGIQPGHLNAYDQRCAEFKIVPDANAYQTGWQQGIRSYCTNANGYNAGAAGLAYNNICPADVAPAFLSGWQQGVRQYCTPANGLNQGLAGRPYRGVCPPDVAPAFQSRYRLGRDVRQARILHHNVEYRLSQVRRSLADEKDPRRYHDLLQDLAHLRHQEEHSEATQAALEACMGNDWYDAGLSDGETGQPYRAGKIAGICRSYGSPTDDIGYRQGWQDGNSQYCTYESGIYAGQGNQEYRGVCHGPAYMLFWGGYLQGLGLFRAGRYEDHPRPRHPRAEHHEQQRHRQQQPRYQVKPNHQAQPQRRSEPARVQPQQHQAQPQPQSRTQAPQAQPAPQQRQHTHAQPQPARAPARSNNRAAQQQRPHAKPTPAARPTTTRKAKKQPVPKEKEKEKEKNGDHGKANQAGESEQEHQSQ
jgi:hypothetical protein